MQFNIVLIKINNRQQKSTDVQKILTEYGCNIKVRLGLNNNQNGICTEDGLIILDVIGNDKDIKKMVQNLNDLKEITAKLINI